MLPEFTIYPGRSNRVKAALTDDGDVYNHTAITRLAVYVGSTLFDSQSLPALFDFSHTDHVEIDLASASPAIPIGRYTCKLVVYANGEMANGYIWPAGFVLNVNSEPGA